MTLAELNELTDNIANIYTSSRPYTTIWLSVKDNTPIVAKVDEDAGGVLRFGDTLTISIQNLDDLHRLNYAVNKLLLDAIKAQDVRS